MQVGDSVTVGASGSGPEDEQGGTGGKLRRGLVAFIAVCILLFMENPLWDAWKGAYLARDKLRTNRGVNDLDEIVLRDPRSLGQFDYRPHFHTVESCSNIHRLATDKPLECDGLLRASSTVESCGGIPLLPGLCVMPEAAKFVYHDRGTSDRVNVVGGDADKSFHKRQICGNDSMSFAEGSFSNFRYHGPGCELLDLNPRWLHDEFKGKLIVVIGDSHGRNLFTSFVAEVRNQKHVAERHVDMNTKDTLSPYQKYEVYRDSDHLVDLTGSNALTFESVREGTKECSSAQSSGAKCSVTILFLWAGFPSEFEKLLTTTLPAIQPDVILTNFVSKAYTTAVGFDNSLKLVMDNFEKLFVALSKSRQASLPPVSFHVSPFPLFGGDQVRYSLAKWLREKKESFASSRVRAHLFDQDHFISAYDRTTGRPLDQLKTTSHTVCSLYDTFSLDPKVPVVGGHRIRGFESCVAPVDRALMRAMFTFAAKDVNAVKR